MKNTSIVAAVASLLLLGMHFGQVRPIMAADQEPRIVFEQHFENVEQMKASGAQFAQGKPELVQFIPGIRGNAMCASDTARPCIYYKNLQDKINPNEGTIEFYLMVDWKDWSLERGKWEVSPIRIYLPEPPNSRLQLRIGNFNGRCLYARMPGDKYIAPIDMWKSKSWHHVAVTWKANSPDGKDEYRIYIDRTLRHAERNCTLTYKADTLAQGQMHILMASAGMHERDRSWAEVADVATAMDELKIWDRQIEFVEASGEARGLLLERARK